MAERPLDGGMDLTLDSLTDSLGFLTRVIHIQIVDRVRASHTLTVSPAVLALLRLVQSNPGIRQVQVAKILLIQESNLANLVKQLIAQELVERRSEAGARRGGLWLTDSGHRIIEDTAAAQGIDRAYATVLSDKEYQQVVRLLNRLYRAAL